MAGKGLNVKNLCEAKRLWKLGLTNRQIGRVIKIHYNTINKYVKKFRIEEADKENIISLPVKISNQIGLMISIGKKCALNISEACLATVAACLRSLRGHSRV